MLSKLASPTFARAAYTISQALSTAAAAANDVGETNKLLSLLGIPAGVIDGYKAYYFQGKSIAESPRDGYVSLDQGSSTSLSPRGLINETAPIDSKYGSWQHYFAEIGLNTTSAAFTLANRYFLVTNLFTLFGFSTAPMTVWPVVLCDAAINMLFNLSNELYETNQQLATYMNQRVEAKPIYAHWRVTKAILEHKNIRDLLIILGTFEHAMIDDILPWLLFIPKNALKQLAFAYRNFSLASAAARAFIVITPILGAFLAALIIFQTILFEAQHSYKACREILDKKADVIKSWFERMNLSPRASKFVSFFVFLMPACHGAATAAPVYIELTKLFSFKDNNIFVYTSFSDVLAILGILAITLFTFLGTFRGHQLSEMREAQELLKHGIN